MLAQIATVLGEHDISIAAFLQHEVEDASAANMVIMTHETTEGAAAKACAIISTLPCVRGEPVRMWVRD